MRTAALVVAVSAALALPAAASSSNILVRIDGPSTIHNSHLEGRGVDKTTSVSSTGTRTWLVKLEPGTYTYLCDPHSAVMRGPFVVR